MPELPEVEITRLGIRALTLGQRIKKIDVRESRLRWPIPKDLLTLKNIEIHKIERRAKYILMGVSTGTIIIHLGMSGRLSIIKNNEPIQKHDHVDFILDNHHLIRYTDPRRFGAILWTNENPLTYPLLSKLGVEPLSKSFDGEYLFKKANSKNVLIKQFIMDQQVVVGVGNIYANESLFAARLAPNRLTNSLTKKECHQLVIAIQKTLKQAILQGGTTLKDFLSPTGKKGYFVQKLLVYGREGQNCFHCQKPLDTLRIGQRSTVFCRVCQL